MINDAFEGAIDTACASSPTGLVARWALIGVVVAVILVRLDGRRFGWRVGCALFAIGVAALVVLAASVRVEATCPRTRRPSREAGPALYEGARGPNDGEMTEFQVEE